MCIRDREYAGDPAIALLLAQDTDVEKTDNGSALSLIHI